MGVLIISKFWQYNKQIFFIIRFSNTFEKPWNKIQTKSSNMKIDFHQNPHLQKYELYLGWNN